MADRIHSYPMFPQNITPNPLQQSQIPQQPPQSQQPDPQMISALSNPEHSRMWQQMNQLQNSYRQQQQSGDLAAASQMNHQMQEFARGQTLSHGQGQPLVPQIQPSFGLSSQRGVFHDPQANQPQSIIPSNFSNMPMSAQQQMKATFNMNPMMHPAMTNPGVPRQLKMLNQHQHQQELARLQQSGLGNQHPPNQPSSVDMFASTSMQPSQDQLHGSPHPVAQPVGPPGANQGVVPGSQQPTAQKKMITVAEFQDRRNYLLQIIKQLENQIASLMQNARTANDPHLLQQLSQLRKEHASRKEMYNAFIATVGAMVSQQMANGMTPSNMTHVNPMAHSTSQQPQPASASNAQGQPGFAAQTNQSIATSYKFSTGPTGPLPSPIPAPAQGNLNQQLPVQPTSIGRPNLPPRTGGTPQQITAGSLPNNNLGNFVAQGGQQKPPPEQTRPTAGIMPLDKSRFESTYAQFCRSQNLNVNANLITNSNDVRVSIGENRTVDLHQLHVQVMHEGGANFVTERDMWAVIGGRLGFIQFPGNDSAPARSGPGIAQQLYNTYNNYLQHFENAYILTVRNRPTGGSPQPSISQMNPNTLAISNNAAPSMSGSPAEVPANPPRPNPQLIATALRFVFTSAQDMRAQRVSEQLITFVDRHRPELMKVYQQQAQIMAAKRSAEQEQQSMANAQGQPPNMSNMHEQPFLGLPPGVPRPPPMGANAMVNVARESKMANGSFVPDNVATLQKQQQPTQDQIQHAVVTINQCKQLFQQRSLPGMAPQHIPEEQRPEYNQMIEQVFRITSELEPKLPLYFAVFKNDEALRRFVAIVMTVARQRQLSNTNSPQYIINPATLRSMQVQVLKLNEEFESRWRAIKTPGAAAAMSQPHAPLPSVPTRASSLTVPQVQNISQMPPPTPQNNGRPASITPRQPTPSQTHLLPPQPHPQSSQTQSHPPQSAVPPQFKKNIQPSMSSSSVPPPLASIASPTPPPTAATTSSSTPATSAPTPQPTHSSPQTPKSPPSKAVAKAKATSRARKMSSASKGPATPEVAPSVAGVKRPPEEDVATLTTVAPSEAEVSNAPSPKKAKTEWDGEPSEALVKKQQEVENIKTDDDAAAFFDRMKELFAMTASTDNEIHHELASTLDQILAGVAQEPADAAATAAALSVHGVGDAGPPPTSLSPHVGSANDAFLMEFIDFSSFTTLEDEDNDSKAPTPDLVPSSETNPSPESGSEGEPSGSTGSPDKTKIDEPGDRSDPLRLGALGEIDGGESAYYQTSEWKWEGPMYTLDHPWAISTA